jgi:hypothetical protein
MASSPAPCSLSCLASRFLFLPTAKPHSWHVDFSAWWLRSALEEILAGLLKSEKSGRYELVCRVQCNKSWRERQAQTRRWRWRNEPIRECITMLMVVIKGSCISMKCWIDVQVHIHFDMYSTGRKEGMGDGYQWLQWLLKLTPRTMDITKANTLRRCTLPCFHEDLHLNYFKINRKGLVAVVNVLLYDVKKSMIVLPLSWESWHTATGDHPESNLQCPM